MWRLLKSFFVRRENHAGVTARRLTEKEAVAIANEAGNKANIPQRFVLAHKSDNNGRPTWTISTAVMGLNWSIEIDDETGQATVPRKWGVR